MKIKLKRSADGAIVEVQNDVLEKVQGGLEVAFDAIVERINEIMEIIKTVKDNELTVEQLENLEEEYDVLEERLSIMKANQGKTNSFRSKVANGGVTTRSIAKANTSFVEPKTDYRSAWLNNIRKLELSDIEKRALNTVSNSSAVTPVEVANGIIGAIKEKSNLLDEITMTYVNGAVKYAVAGADDEAVHHTEGAKLTSNSANLVEVALNGYEIIKLIQISDTVKQMSVGAFEQWLIENISNAIVRTINKDIIMGSGSNQPTGIEKSNTWDDTNSVTVAKVSALVAENVLNLVGMLDSNFDENAKFVMKKRTLFTDFMPLQDKAKNDLVTREGKDYYILGYPVLFDENVKANEAYFGDLTKVSGNLAENINIKNAYDIDTNTYKYSGIAIFDCKPAVASAFVKLVKATA